MSRKDECCQILSLLHRVDVELMAKCCYWEDLSMRNVKCYKNLPFYKNKATCDDVHIFTRNHSANAELSDIIFYYYTTLPQYDWRTY